VICDYLSCPFDEVGCWSRLELAIRFAYELYEGRYKSSEYIGHLHSLSEIVEDFGINTALTAS
jgi:hypothetical protein